MAGYLKKYIKFYRVLADYDLATNDFPRDAEGNIDSSFDDFYIPCASKSKIRHYEQRILLYYCPSIGRFRNILKQIYEDKIGDLEKFKTYKTNKKCEQTFTFDIKKMYKELLDKEIILYITEYEDEGEFRFHVDMMDYVAKLVKAKTSGANISPFSTKNLPSKKYTIPNKELEQYKEIISKIDKSNMSLLSQFTREFDKIIHQYKGKEYNIKFERKLSCLSGKDFIHYIGLFDKFLEFLQEKIS